MRKRAPEPHLLTPATRLLLNGADASAADLQYFVLSNYSHYSSLQYAEGGVRGLSLHLERLDHSSRELFGHSLPAARVRQDLRRALEGCTAASVRINVFSRELQLQQLETDAAPDLLISVRAPSGPARPPLRVRSVVHQRYLPQVKHAGTFSLFHQRREALRAGYDDALFVSHDGEILEGSIWNIGFWDGRRVCWPQAPVLPGITQQLLTPALRARGLNVETRRMQLTELSQWRGAFFSHSGIAVQPLASIDEQPFNSDTDFYAELHAAWAQVPVEAI